jgi:hypothetical protein
VTKAEQETTIRWAADEAMVSVWTAIPKDRRKLEKAGYRPYRVSTQAGKPVGWFYRIPLAEFRWRGTAGRKARPMTPEQRQAAGDRLRRGRNTP